jgi:cytochrome c biogenesis protein CcdA
VEAVVGAGALVAAALLWRAARKPADEAKPPRSVTAASAFALGAGITALELPTAFPYFGAVSAILGADSGAPTRIALVLAYNVLFVLPLVLVFALRNRIEPRIAAILLWLRRVAPLALAAVVGVGGALLLALGAAGLLTA